MGRTWKHWKNQKNSKHLWAFVWFCRNKGDKVITKKNKDKTFNVLVGIKDG